MIRPFTLITMLLAALSGAYLFAVKHRAQVLDDQIATVSEQSRLDAQRIRVLQAQWALEIDPNRLQQLAAQFSSLQPMQPSQLVTLAALQLSLPPPGTSASGPNPELQGQGSPGFSDAEVASAGPASAQNLPLPPPMAPPPSAPPARTVLVAFASPAPTNFAHRVSHSQLHIANTQLAEDLPPPRPLYVVRPPAPATPMGAEVMSVKATATLPPAATPVSSGSALPMSSGSALGMAADLAPPQPLTQGGLSN